jgi:hypothetical protein
VPTRKNGKKFLDESFKDGTYGVDYTKFVPLLLDAVKDIYGKWLTDHSVIAKIKTENADLKRENAAIRAYLCKKDPQADFCAPSGSLE